MEIISAKKYPDKEKLLSFYHEIFPGRANLPTEYWSWLYTGSNNSSAYPLLAVESGKIIGHAGGTPCTLNLNEKSYSSAWFNDFMMLEPYRGKGVGKKLTEAWMAQVSTGITFCNDQSIEVFNKFGWEESFSIDFHTLFIRPFNHPKIAKKIPRSLSSISNRLYKYAFIKNAAPIETKPYTTNDKFSNLLDNCTDRTDEYWEWRVTTSPQLEKYSITGKTGSKVLFKLSKDSYGNYIDILYIENLADVNTVLESIQGIIQLGIEEGYDFIRLLAPQNHISKLIKQSFKSYVTHPRFAFFASNDNLRNEMRNAEWNWQLIDSDFEKFVNEK